MSPSDQEGTKQPEEFVKIIFLQPNSWKIRIGNPTSSNDRPS